MVDWDKPVGIALLTYFLWLLALIMISLAAYVLFYGGEFWYNGMLQGLSSRTHRIIAIIGFALAITFAGIGFMNSSQGGRLFLMGLSILGMIQGIVVLMENFIRGMIILLVCVFVAGYMLTPRVSAVFKPIDSKKAVDAIDALDKYRRSRSLR